MLAPSDGTTTRRYLEWPQPDCLKNSQCKWRIVRLGLRLPVAVDESKEQAAKTLVAFDLNTKTRTISDANAKSSPEELNVQPIQPPTSLKITQGGLHLLLLIIAATSVLVVIAFLLAWISTEWNSPHTMSLERTIFRAFRSKNAVTCYANWCADSLVARRHFALSCFDSAVF
jgi:hypothetical protein